MEIYHVTTVRSQLPPPNKKRHPFIPQTADRQNPAPYVDNGKCWRIWASSVGGCERMRQVRPRGNPNIPISPKDGGGTLSRDIREINAKL